MWLTSSSPTSSTSASNRFPRSAAIFHLTLVSFHLVVDSRIDLISVSFSLGDFPQPNPVAELQMAPLVESFPASQLAARVQYVPNGKRRKPPVDLKDCELKELLQYHCDLNGPKDDPKSVVECEPVLRLFRKWVCLLTAMGAKFAWRARTDVVLQVLE
jgi:inner membrane protease subunit SOM1